MSATSEISYAWSADTRLARGIIRTIENLTGRPRLIRMAHNYEQDVAAGRDFWAVMQDRYCIRLDFVEGSPECLPASGPTVVVANHPFGILDGLALGRLMSMRRADFKIVAHTVFNRAPEVARHILPISFDNTREAHALNVQTRRDALQFLDDGGAIAVFPGGCVSTASKPFGQPIDPRWKNFTAKLASHADAQVVPLFFEGSNSRTFQAISHLSQTLRYALLINEFRTGITQPVRMRLGEPMERAQIDALKGDAVALMDHLRNTVYGLSRQPFEHLGYGWNGE